MYTRSQRLMRRKIAAIGLSVFITFWASSLILGYTRRPQVNAMTPAASFTREQLSRYNGTQSDKPIYLAFEGNVYDVTQGYRFYAAGGTYHFLAGRDATSELRIAGGDIIKRKYPVVGILKDN